MEVLAIPVIALGALYMMSNQKKEDTDYENFSSRLPNVDLPDRNIYEDDDSSPRFDETDRTAMLSTVNRYDGPEVYTDKFFNSSRYPAVKQTAETRQFDSLTGDKVNSDYFKHNNMVPYFGGNIRSETFSADGGKYNQLDSMIGLGTHDKSKEEQAPLFAPAENLQWAHGAPNATDFVRSRMNVGMKMSNVKPFEEERVSPGLAGQSGQGFNSGMMAREQWLPKTVDELRVNNNPRVSHMLMGHEGPAMSRITNLGSIGQMEKNRPERMFENGPERYMTTTGLAKGQTLQAVTIQKDVNRTTTTQSYVGGAGASNSEMYVDGEYMPSKHIDLGPVPLQPANAVGRSEAREGEYELNAKMAYPNNRTTTRTGDYFGAIGGAFGSVIAPLLDVLRPSRRENTIGSLRPYQNPSSHVQNSYLFNPADRPAATIRETTEKSKNHHNINAGQRGGAYETTECQPSFTTRETTGNFFYSGVGEGAKESRRYDAEYAQRNNDIKSATIEGRMVPGNMSLMQGDIHMTGKARETKMQNKRPAAPSMPYQSPDMNNYGKIHGSQSLYSTIQMDRTKPEFLDALKSNPYTLSVVNAL